MMYRFSTAVVLSSALSANAKTFLEAIGAYPQLSNFTTFVKTNKAIFPFSADSPLTVLVPDDNAFANYKKTYGVEVTSLPPADLAPLFSSHLLVGALNGDNFTNPAGTTCPTLLTSPQYSNRTASGTLPAQDRQRIQELRPSPLHLLRLLLQQPQTPRPPRQLRPQPREIRPLTPPST
ncbi:uncharacterized protein BDZ99DRAFT_110924 [Mytilinidion resinicola]|uniref:FAS1 domain-containing protein n=1 Tax=Mytilinidion resinicola TaxID=574789 RepID=A0A6A6YAB1_9PEZI|nr:uncharacterized protein BDZ99DRAFT_110924 [Mytilinidion resinicola]KAF2805761.1 hypothetical protein BDZ99DRAFT_110924 [Mytilinidion resinicola]